MNCNIRQAGSDHATSGLRAACKMCVLARITRAVTGASSMHTRIKVRLAAVFLAFAAGTVFAQTYPTKPVKMIVPFGAGGPADIYARAIAQRLSEPLGQQGVVEGR